MLSGSISTGLGFIVTAVKFPLYIHFLGYEKYGVWLLLSTISVFAQMGLLGIGSAIIKLVAEEYEQRNHEAIQEYFTTAICMLIVMGVGLLATSTFFKAQIILLMGLKGENAELATRLLVYMVIFSVGVLIYQVLNSILAGIGRIDLANYSQTAIQIIPLPVSVLLFLLGKGVVSVLLANVFAYLVVFFVNLRNVNKIVSINLIKITSCSLQRFLKMITFGSTVFMGHMVNMMVLPITKIVITKSIGVEGLPVFELSYRVSTRIRSIFVVAFKALLPEISNLSLYKNKKSIDKLGTIISKSYRLLFLGAMPIYILAFILAGIIFKVWLGESFIPSITDVFRVFLLVSFVSLIGVIPYYFNMGHGRVKIILIHYILQACGTLISVGLSVYLMSSIDMVTITWCFLPGAILGTSYLLISQTSNHSPTT